ETALPRGTVPFSIGSPYCEGCSCGLGATGHAREGLVLRCGSVRAWLAPTGRVAAPYVERAMPVKGLCPGAGPFERGSLLQGGSLPVIWERAMPREELVLRCGSVRERGSLLPVAGKTSALRQLLVQLRQAERELLRLLDQGVAVGAEHVWQVITGLAVDGDAERHQPLTAGLKDRLAGIFDAVAALVDIQIIGLAVSYQQQQLTPLRAFAEQLG